MEVRKEIALKLRADKETDFYYKLYQSKVTKEIQAPELQEMMDCISFDEQKAIDFLRLPYSQRKVIFRNLYKSWQYLYKVRNYHESYSKIACLDYKTFRKTSFGKEITSAYYVINKLQEYWESESPIEIKSALAYLSEKINLHLCSLNKALHHHLNILSFLPENIQSHLKDNKDGQIVLMDSGEKEVPIKIYYQKQEGLIQITTLNEWKELKEQYYLCYQKAEELIWVKESSNKSQVVVRQFSANIENGEVKSGSDTRCFVFTIEKKKSYSAEWDSGTSGQSLEPDENIIHYFELESIAEDTQKAVQTLLPRIKKINLLDTLKELPVTGKDRHLYKRDLLINRLLDIVMYHFPFPVSDHVRHNVTGYLCITFGVVDSEDEHIDSNRKTATHHEYVGKTVRNSLYRKPYSNTF
jgi:hypothetical protein